MGKKTKVGKDRKDKFYKLAKETGFRSRAAFKLIQLNRKFGFLQSSQVCVDLCAAPGGWMQVAKENMPVSSIVIGIDLYPIRPIAGCISLVEDITTEKCKHSIAKELQTWKADVFLHDGAPNVGRNWLYDAYQQICLTLNAVKLATQFLRSGGWFVTKVFRSKDYNALLWVLKQLFKKVHATKPSASRKESAEIFIVCQHYLAPNKIDPKFLDPKYVFEEIELETKNPQTLLQSDKRRIKAEGYSESDFLQRQELSVTDFLKHSSGLSALQGISQIIFDDSKIENHVKTTNEIKECCKDIKVLGRKDIRLLLAWWKSLKAELFPKIVNESVEPKTEVEKIERTEEEIVELELENLNKHILDLKVEEAKELKRKKKKVQKARQKLNEKLNLKMVLKGDMGPQEEDADIFSLRQIQGIGDVDKLQDVSPDMLASDEIENVGKFTKKFKRYAKEQFNLDDDGMYVDDEQEMLGSDSDDAKDMQDDASLTFENEIDEITIPQTAINNKNIGKNPLLTDLDTRDKDAKRQQRVQLWFEKDILKGIDNSVNEDCDLNELANRFKKKGVRIFGEQNNNQLNIPDGKDAKQHAKYVEENEINDNINDDDHSDDNTNKIQKISSKENGEMTGNAKKYQLTEEELALGAIMVQSKKDKNQLIDFAWNRYAFNDENLPQWFVEDEKLHMRKEAPVPADQVENYRKKVEELNVRPIKKVMEAKARKKRRALKRFEKAKKKAETILENADSSAQDKIRQIKKLYKKAQNDKKPEITYVVAKKHLAGKRVKRPAGVKGRFRVVDPRMKKDKRASIAKEKTKGRRKKR